MKKFNIITLLASFLFFGSIMGQQDQETMDDMGRISLAVYLPENSEGMTPSANKVLGNKLNQIATKNGIGGDAFSERFIMRLSITTSITL